MRSAGPALRLWDVRDVEAHVRTLSAAWLRENNARLDQVKLELLVQALVRTCWLISGLQADGRTLRPGYAPRLTVRFPAPRWSSLQGLVDGETEELGPFNSPLDATAAGERRAEYLTLEGCIVETEIVERRPRGAYDPKR